MEEKKESWIEKLVELLNEYDTFREYVEVDLEDCNDPIVLRVISKNYGFIKWLVENDKIDKSKVFSFIDTSDKPYEDILCLLALSDEPISYLISILK